MLDAFGSNTVQVGYDRVHQVIYYKRAIKTIRRGEYRKRCVRFPKVKFSDILRMNPFGFGMI